jgi:hypothetical protein
MEDPVAVLAEMARVTRRRVVVLEASPDLRWRAVVDRRLHLPLKTRLDYVFWLPALRAARRFTDESLARAFVEAGLADPKIARAGRGLYLLGHADPVAR